MSSLLDAARDLATLGWPVMWIKPRAKEPLTRHGVKDATTVERTILHWHDRWPDANLAIATGHPGPQVLDIDNPQAAGDIIPRLKRTHPPTVASVRGPHLYFRGLERPTISLGFGELRGQGSYILVPPSIHPSGKHYVWLDAPHGPLPAFPDNILPPAVPAGIGDFKAPDLIPHGERHDALKDAAVRFLRGGFTDVPTLEQMLKAFFEARCDPKPPAKRGEFRKLAEWAANTRIADRERQPNSPPDPETETEKPARKKSKLAKPPSLDATLAEHRAYIRLAGGWSEHVDIKDVYRYGSKGTDALEIELTNGLWVTFERQDQVTTRGHWGRTVIACTHGHARPVPSLTDGEALAVFGSLCILASAPPDRREREHLEDVIADLVAATEAIADHDLADAGGRYDVTARCRARATYDPKNRGEDAPKPVLIIDKHGNRYVRAGEVRDFLNYHGLGISAAALPGRMAMIGFERVTLDGREPARPEGGLRRTNRMQLYQLPKVELE